VLERIKKWREICPDLAIARPSWWASRRDGGGFPVSPRLAGRGAARPRRRFRFEPVEGATANDLPGAVPEAVKEERYARLMEKTEAISAARLQRQGRPHHPRHHRRGGRTDEDGDMGATGRSQADAPEIDGQVLLRDVPADLRPGMIVMFDRRC
jgi:ribosomal protein S12 methylthiotransferase